MTKALSNNSQKQSRHILKAKIGVRVGLSFLVILLILGCVSLLSYQNFSQSRESFLKYQKLV